MRKKSISKGQKYKYFVIGLVVSSDAWYNETPRSYQIVRGLNQETVKRRFKDLDRNPEYTHKIIGEYETKQEAWDALVG